MDYVFGYASLVTDAAGAGTVARLPGYRRVWGVATDNAAGPQPGYKMYIDRASGTRPAIFVAFVDIVEAEDSVVNGVAKEVDETELAQLNLRERNYDRIDVSERIEGVEGRIWTYRGSASGRARLRDARARDRVVVSRDYRDHVLAGFRALGPDAQREFERSSDLSGLPIRDLDRVDLPADPPTAVEPA